MFTADGTAARSDRIYLYDPYGQNLDPGTGAFGDTPIPSTAAGGMDFGWLGQNELPVEHLAGLQAIEMGARTYLPILGRFLQVDPVAGGSANDYDYVGGDPINKLDTSGMCPECAIEAGEEVIEGVEGIIEWWTDRNHHKPESNEKSAGDQGSRTGKIALGLFTVGHNPYALLEFAERRNAKYYRDWPSGGKDWVKEFKAFVDDGHTQIYFNLDGIGTGAAARAHADKGRELGDPTLGAHVTAWELNYIRDHPDAWSRTHFYFGYEDGKENEVENPFQR